MLGIMPALKIALHSFGIESAIEIEIGTCQYQPSELGHPLQSLQAFRQQDRIGFIDRRHREGANT